MRFTRRLLGVLWFGIVLAGCDSTQPLQVTSQTLTLNVTGINALARQYDVWDLQEDSNLDGTGDGPVFSWCKPPVPNFAFPADSVPLTFGIEVGLIREGETEPVRISPNVALQFASNLSQYEPNVIDFLTPNLAPICLDSSSAVVDCADVSVARRFVFTNPRRLSAAARVVVAGIQNPLSTANSSFGLGNGLCSVNDPGPARVETAPLPYSVTIEKGDTIIFTLRRGALPPGLVADVLSVPELSTELQLDGNQITPVGDTTTSATQDTISFYFTAR